MLILFLITGVLIGPILLLPPREMWIWVNGLCFPLGWVALQIPPTLRSGASFVDAVATLIFWGFVALAVAALILRIVISAVRHGNAPIEVPKRNWPWPLVISNGVGVAIIVIGIFMDELSGSTHAVGLHLGLIGAGLVFGAFGVIVWRIFPIGVAIGLLALTLYSAAYSTKVVRSAQMAANGTRYCIYLNKRQQFSQSRFDLTFLTLDKVNGWPHAVLVIEGHDGPVYGNWSYRNGRFMVPWDVHVRQPTLQCPH